MRERVSVVGDFNIWDGRRHPMRRRGATGVWETFIPGLGEGTAYKYEIRGPGGALLPLKADPVGLRVRTSARKCLGGADRFGGDWHDGDWMERRAAAATTSTRRSRSTRCIWGRGGARRATGC